MAWNFGSINWTGSGYKNSRPPFESAYIFILLFFVGFLVSDYLTTYFRASMLPVGGVTRVNTANPLKRGGQSEASIFINVKNRNIFNADHFIPDSLGEKASEGGGAGGEGGVDNTPVLTSLPLKLLGTIIHGARERSVATIQGGGKDIVAVVAGEEVEDMARIHDITAFKVIFRNLRNRKMEYIEIKEENKIDMGVASQKGVGNSVADKTDFTFERTEINKYLENLPKILQEARAVPYVAPGDTDPSGWKLVAIKTGSIFEKLGLVRGDIIKSVNGETVDSAQQAMEMYQTLRNSDNIRLEIRRGADTRTNNYTIQ
jgi:general secretion pathway protein C